MKTYRSSYARSSAAGYEMLQVSETLGFRTDDIEIWHLAIRSEAVVATCNRRDFLALREARQKLG